MRKRLAMVLLGGLIDAGMVVAQSRPPAPTARQIKAALDEKAESDLVTYLQKQPPGTAAGHVVRVDAVTGVTCNPVQQKDVVCRFIAHQGLMDRKTTSTLTLDHSGWHIIEQ